MLKALANRTVPSSAARRAGVREMLKPLVDAGRARLGRGDPGNTLLIGSGIGLIL